MSAALADFDDDGFPLDADLNIPSDIPRGIFADNYAALRRLGWPGVLWLPEGQKSPPLGKDEPPLKRSLTGYNGVDCDASELHLLASSILRRGQTGRGRGFSGARGNIAVRAPQNVIKEGVAYDLAFLDLDDYVKGDKVKTGAKTVADIEAKAGVRFAATCKISSRGDGVSGKYAYLVLVGTMLVRECKPDVELVQWFHRYAVAPPSTNADSGGTTVLAYRHAAPRAGECVGELINGMFRPEDATIMAAELVAELTDSNGRQDGRNVSNPEVQAFLDGLPVDEVDPKRMCKATVNALDKGLTAMRQPGSAFEATRGAVMRLLRLGHMGHTGVPTAFTELEQAYVATQRAPGDTEMRARGEVQRMIYNPRGVGLILANPTPEEDRGCRCGLVITDDALTAILEAGEEGLGFTLDEIRDLVGADRYDAVAARLTPRTNGEAPAAAAPAAVAVAPSPNPPAVRATGAPAEQPLRRPLRVEARRTGQVPPLFDGSYTNDDVGNGRRFVALWGDDVVWVPDEKRTYTWAGQRWEHDTGAQMRHLAERLTDYMLAEAHIRLVPAQQRFDALAGRPDDDRAKIAAGMALEAAKADLKWTKTSRMDKLLKACVISATSHPGISVRSGEWDADAWLLNAGNGTLRLKLDGEHTFGKARREDRLTQQAAVHYDPEAVALLFLAALERWLPDSKVRRLVRALVGISLLGNNSRHKFPLFIGEERSGKTTLAETIAGMLDNPAEPAVAYSGSFKLADLRPQRNGASPNASLFHIVRRRFVYCSESNDGGQPLSADLIKRFCGGDRQQARDTYGKARSIDDKPPAFTPVLATNKNPEVEGADPALRERVITIWFGRTIPKPERDADFPEKLKPEYPGILNWALDGYRDAVQHPEIFTDLPQECIDKAAVMFQAMTVYERWKVEETAPSDNKAEWIGTDESWKEFVAWCAEQREDSKTKWKFGAELKTMGHPSKVEHIHAEEGQIGDGTSARVRVGLAWSERHHERVTAAREAYKAEREHGDEDFADHGV